MIEEADTDADGADADFVGWPVNRAGHAKETDLFLRESGDRPVNV